jgi:hypothetical protein
MSMISRAALASSCARSASVGARWAPCSIVQRDCWY